MLQRIFGKDGANELLQAESVIVEEPALYEDDCFAQIATGGFGAGPDKCLIQQGVSGWTTTDVVLEEVLEEEFSFVGIGMPELDDAYREFCQTPEIKKLKMRGNDRVRWMVAGIYQGDRIYLTLQKTCFSMTSFWWSRVRDKPEIRKAMANHVFMMEEPFYPNSLCLHLIVETQDEYLVCTKISRNKNNDYGSTVAITLGEQISQIDFGGNTSYNNHFVAQWIKRSLIEEFGFGNEEYEKYVDASSARVLALSYEGDIYNFALPTYIRLKIDFKGFLACLGSRKINIAEFTEIMPATADEALKITESWETVEGRTLYHPSSFLRASLYAFYKGVGC